LNENVENPERSHIHDLLVRCARAYLQRRRDQGASSPLLGLLWEEFYQLYAREMDRLVPHSFLDTADRADLVQEAWLAVARKLPDFPLDTDSSGFPAWLAKVVHDKVVDRLRSRARHPTGNLDALRGAREEPVGREPDPAVAAERSCDGAVLRAVLDDLWLQLSERNFQILQLHFWEGRPVAEIADLLGLTPAEVSARQHRLLRKVRDRLLQRCGEDIRPAG
jgi:RNA polymerase sigma-70 factor (ECF subfamily)